VSRAATATRTYGRPFAEAYDVALGDAAAPTIIAGVEDAITRFALPERRIADVGCGTGQLLNALIAPGRRLIGVDRSPFMLQQARRRLGPGVTLLLQDMRALALPAPVDLILCCFATVNYLLGREEMDRTFAAFAANLRTGGHLIIDFIPHMPDRAPAYRLKRTVETRFGRSIWQSEVDPRRGLTRTSIAFPGKAGESVAVEHHTQRWLPIPIVRQSLDVHGLRPIDMQHLGGGGPTRWVKILACRKDARAL
jgi:SAM-dependent methyltransferase